jgi:branched-chain amino acid transport system permease protein
VDVPVAQLMVGGVTAGCAYALLAVAYSLVYRTSRTINFAQGNLAMLGAYVAFAGPALFTEHRVLGVAAGLVTVGALSVAIDRTAFRPLYRHGTVFIVASSIALVFVIETVVRLVWGSQTISADPLIDGTTTFGSLYVSNQRLLIGGVLVLTLLGLQVLFRSRTGIAIRASAESPQTARLLGISPTRMITVSFALAGVVSAAAGILLAPLTQLTPGSGAIIGQVAITAAIVGGFGSIPGAVLGGIFIGLVEVWTTYVAGSSYALIATFGVLIVVLLVRPSGLLGEEGLSDRR